MSSLLSRWNQKLQEAKESKWIIWNLIGGDRTVSENLHISILWVCKEDEGVSYLRWNSSCPREEDLIPSSGPVCHRRIFTWDRATEWVSANSYGLLCVVMGPSTSFPGAVSLASLLDLVGKHIISEVTALEKLMSITTPALFSLVNSSPKSRSC